MRAFYGKQGVPTKGPSLLKRYNSSTAVPAR